MSHTHNGSINHLESLVSRLNGTSARPLLNPIDRMVISTILKQEIIRRRLIESDSKKISKLGVNIEEIKQYPEWVRKSSLS